MSLDIKELFNSDLDPNNNSWWASPKIDKLNHNFNQLIEGGVRGPKGNQGTAGLTGLKGAQGVQGLIGVQGFQGEAGQDANLNWRSVTGPTNRTLYPNIEQDDYFGVSLIFGVPESATEYQASATFNLVSQLRVIAETGKKQMSLRFGDLDYDFKFDGSQYSSNLFIGKLAGSITTNLTSVNELNNSTIEYKSTGATTQNPTILQVTDDLLSVNNTSRFPNLSANKLKFTPSADSAKILTSSDNTGNLVWKNKYEALSILPIGSIVSIPEYYFNNSNFELIDAAEVVDGVLQVYWGRGKDNTAYSGWYLCNGRTWNFQGGNQFPVPNLNAFTYNIDSNGGNQPLANGGSNTPILIGGANAAATATQNPSTFAYSIDQTIDMSDISEIFQAGSTHSVPRNVHIINLGNPYLTWQTVASGVLSEEIILGYGSSTSESSCEAPSGTFYWTGSGILWSDIYADLTGVALYDSNNNVATANKWYERDGVSRYWNGTAFTQVQSCPLAVSIDLGYNNDVRNLNGTISSSGSYTINDTSFSTATTLKYGGSNASAGWYRETSGSGARRYWNGSIFVGDTISTTYVYYTDALDVSYNNSSSACQYTDAAVKIYYATNTQVGVSSGNYLQDIYNALGVVYVHKDWTTALTGAHPLVKIYTQNGVGGGVSPYGSILTDANNGSTYRATITTVSKILQPVVCSNYTINGVTTVNNATTSTFGTITVTNTPAVITLTAFGGSGYQCSTDAQLQVVGVGYAFAYADGYDTSVDTITINSTGTYNYNLSANFGCSSGNYATIS